jgi:hypothetical protein
MDIVVAEIQILQMPQILQKNVKLLMSNDKIKSHFSNLKFPTLGKSKHQNSTII